MLQLRKEQMQAFAAAAEERFAVELVDHLFHFSPFHARQLGTDVVGSIVRYGIEKAKAYGFTQKGPIRFYLELMFLLGSAFDSDPQFLWLSGPLFLDQSPLTEISRAQQAFHATTRYLDEVAGAENCLVYQSLLRVRSHGFLVHSPHAAPTTPQLLNELGIISPEKAKFLGEDCLAALIQRSQSEVVRIGSNRASDYALLTLLMYGLGHGDVWKTPNSPG